MEWMICAGLFCAYILGSVNFSVLICRIFKKPDPRFHGSLNPGATNVARVAGKKIAFLVLFLDMMKGVFSVWMAPFGTQSWFVLSVCLGHMFPIFYRFSGGKGVATAAGSMMLYLPFMWFGILLSIVLGLIAVTGYVSLGSLTGALILLVYSAFDSNGPIAVLSFLMIWKHRSNMTRLISGTESKIY